MESAEQAIEELGEMGKRTLYDGIGDVVKAKVHASSGFIRALEIGTSIMAVP